MKHNVNTYIVYISFLSMRIQSLHDGIILSLDENRGLEVSDVLLGGVVVVAVCTSNSV